MSWSNERMNYKRPLFYRIDKCQSFGINCQRRYLLKVVNLRGFLVPFIFVNLHLHSLVIFMGAKHSKNYVMLEIYNKSLEIKGKAWTVWLNG